MLEWRILCLALAGFDFDQTHRLANSDADLHEVINMVSAKCPHALVLEIVL